MSYSLIPIWGDDPLVFQWGDFSEQEAETLRHYYRGQIVTTLTGPPHPLALSAMEWFTKHFACLQDNNHFDRRLRIIACYINQGGAAECSAEAVSLNRILGCQNPTYAIHINIHAVPMVIEHAASVMAILQRQIERALGIGVEEPPSGGNCALFALMFVFLHELSHIVRGHLEWSARFDPNDSKALELDADFIGASYCGGFVRHYFHEDGSEPSLADQSTEGTVAIMAMYCTFSCLDEGDVDWNHKYGSYYSPMARLLLVAYRLAETMHLDQDYANSVVIMLIDGFKMAVQANPALTKALNFVPGHVESERAELAELARRRLLPLENEGRLNGWRCTPTHAPVLVAYGLLLKESFVSPEPHFLDRELLPAPKGEIRRQLLKQLGNRSAEETGGIVSALQFLSWFVDDYQRYEREVPGFFEDLNVRLKNGTLEQVLTEVLAWLEGRGQSEPHSRAIVIANNFAEILEACWATKALLDQDLAKLGLR